MGAQEHTQRCVWSRVLEMTKGKASFILPGARMGTQWYSGAGNIMVLIPSGARGPFVDEGDLTLEPVELACIEGSGSEWAV